MKAILIVAGLALAGCTEAKPPLMQCPDLATVVPSSVGVPFVTDLTARLQGPDRENSIAEAIAEIHRRDPGASGDIIVNILIAADCPNALAKPDHDMAADRARIAGFRAQVDQLLGTLGTQ